MKKGNFISRIIYSIIVTLMLFYFFHKTPNGQLILLPFLICSISILIKNIFLLMNKEKYVDLFNKIFVFGFSLFWFGFLIYWCYTNFISKDYSLILLSVPFWIAGIYVIKKKFFKVAPLKASNKKIKINFRVIISVLLVTVALLSGILMLFFGIKDTYKTNKQTENYITINGYYKDYEIYNRDEDGTTYKLIYIYEVNGKNYSITTDYGTNYIPEENSIREVKYNPNNPEDAILVGTTNNNVLIFVGVFFILGSSTFVIFALTILGYFDKFKIDVIGTYIGFVLVIIGIGILLIQNGITMSLLETIKSFGLWILIPLMFIIVGIYQVIKCLFIDKGLKNKYKK